MFELFDEVYDSEAYIFGVILAKKDNNYNVFWKNGVMGQFNSTMSPEVTPTGRNLGDVELKYITKNLQENPLLD